MIKYKNNIQKIIHFCFIVLLERAWCKPIIPLFLFVAEIFQTKHAMLYKYL